VPHPTQRHANALGTDRAFGGRPRQYLGLRYLRVRACGFAVHHHSPDAANYVIYARLQRAICHRGHTELFELS
jgi:hypothetical protein